MVAYASVRARCKDEDLAEIRVVSFESGERSGVRVHPDIKRMDSSDALWKKLSKLGRR